MTKQSFLDPSGYEDHFARERLPPPDLWPDMRSDRPEFVYSKRMNAAIELLDTMFDRGFVERAAGIFYYIRRDEGIIKAWIDERPFWNGQETETQRLRMTVSLVFGQTQPLGSAPRPHDPAGLALDGPVRRVDYFRACLRACLLHLRLGQAGHQPHAA